jgi:DNA replication and repair protein RecF
MVLDSLHLQNFKNYSDCTINFNPGLNFIYGDNGNGKTNLLEAVSFLCYTRSFLQNSESDCVKYGSDLFDVSGQFHNELSVTNKISLRYYRENSDKRFTANNEPIGKLSAFFGTYPLVVLSPQDMKLTTGLPADRRKNFDILISQLSRVYFDDLKRYSKVIKQKNALLKENLTIRRYQYNELLNLIEPWNEELIELGSRLIARRIKLINEFRPYIIGNFSLIVGAAYEPSITYESESGNSESESDLKEAIALNLRDKYENEIRRGISLVGPHRDNYVFSLLKSDGTFDVKTFASQGEHKTFLVSLKLAEYRYLKDNIESYGSGEPILLLDDVFSDLDKSRIEKICSILPAYKQAFLTTTNKDYLDIVGKYFDKDNISSFKITNGSTANIS